MFFEKLINSALALITWSLVIMVLLYTYRIPAMSKNKVSLRRIAIKNTEEYRQEQKKMPVDAIQIAENYNHLMEQPTVFYALVFYCHLTTPPTDAYYPLFLGCAWAYVALRIVHSIIQCFNNVVIYRFGVFALSSIVLMTMAGLALVREVNI